MTKIYTALTLLAVAFLGFTGTAFAASEVAPSDGSWLDLAKPVYDAVIHGQYWLGASLALILAVALAKKYLPGKAGAFVNGEYGAPLTVLLMSFGGAVATALGAGQAVMSAGLAWTAFKVAVGAAGGYSLLKKLLAPLLRKLAAKAPSWMQPIFAMILFVFDKPTAVETAEKAGDDAVAAKPPTGAPKNDVTEI